VSLRRIETSTSVIETSTSVIEHVLARLKAIGISRIFGVPGDFVFSVNDAIVKLDAAMN
jgi:TPP-dependent 2-oxoacid decarboxylase